MRDSENSGILKILLQTKSEPGGGSTAVIPFVSTPLNERSLSEVEMNAAKVTERSRSLGL